MCIYQKISSKTLFKCCEHLRKREKRNVLSQGHNFEGFHEERKQNQATTKNTLFPTKNCTRDEFVSEQNKDVITYT